MTSQAFVSSEPVLINKYWAIFPLFLPTILSLICVFFGFILLSLFNETNSSPGNVGFVMVISVAVIIFTAVYLLFSLGSLITITYRRLAIKTFKLYIGSDHLVVQSGILNKSERTIPFSVIQNIILSHSLTDYFLNLASIRIENASNSGMIFSTSGSSDMAMSNMVSIPCLSADLALNVRNQLLEKIKIFNRLSPGQGI